MNRERFPCPGLVFKALYAQGQSVRHTLIVIEQIYINTCDMRNVFTGEVFPMTCEALRSDIVELVGRNFKVKL